VPVLVDGDEVVNDSRRILQYLDWAYAGEGMEGASATTTMSADE
jgi:glutathione S-transferase